MKKARLKNFKLLAFVFSFLIVLSSCGQKTAETPTTCSVTQITGADPLFSQQWHLINESQNSFSSHSGTTGQDLQMTDAITQELTGNEIKIAISDSGAQESHEDLCNNIVATRSRNYLNSANSSSGLESQWIGKSTPSIASVSANYALAHGTAVTGIIGALANNSTGGRGVAPGAALIPFLFVQSDQSEDKFVDQAQGDFDIFNYSYGFPSCEYTPINSSLQSQMRTSATNSIFIKASGNEFVSSLEDCDETLSEFNYLGNANFDGVNTQPEVMVVAAINAKGLSSSYSSPGANIWVNAPGGEFGDDDPAIVTTDYEGCSYGLSQTPNNTNSFESGDNSLNSQCNYTSTMNGTSSATPNTSGAVALLLEANPILKPRDVKYILAKTARRVDPTAGNTSHPGGASYNLPGHIYQQGWVKNAADVYFHNWYGFGAVDVDAAIAMAKNSYSLLGDLQTDEANSGTLDPALAIPDNSATGVTSTLTIGSDLIIESVEITFSITHPKTSNLGLELYSPSGTKSILMNINSGIIQSNFTDTHFITNAFLDEHSNGTWTLKAIDGATNNTGTLTSWKIKINGHAPPSRNKKGDFVRKSPLFSIFESFKDYFTNS